MKKNYTHPSLNPIWLPSPTSGEQGRLSEICVLASLLEQVQKESAARATLHNGKAVPGGKIRVMLADDDCDDRELFVEVIAGINTAIQVIAVEDGLQLMTGLNETQHALPAMIFLDLNMPGKSGKDCLAEIKNNPRFRDIPVVIYSTSVSKKDIHETHDGGANLYVSKPNSYKGLIAVVAKVFAIDLEQLKLTPPINQFVVSADIS